MPAPQTTDWTTTLTEQLTAWTKRREEALETGLEALTRMSAAKTPVEAAVICSDWISGSITRVMADFGDAQANGLRLAQHFQHASRAMLETPPPPAVAAPAIVTSTPPPPEQHFREAAD